MGALLWSTRRYLAGAIVFLILTAMVAAYLRSEFKTAVRSARKDPKKRHKWVRAQPETAALPLGYFGASTGAAAALSAAAARDDVSAVVARGGRPDLAGFLESVTAPTLLIVGGNDVTVLELNRQAMRRMKAEVRLEIVPGASHLFGEPGALERVAELARDFFLEHLRRADRAA